MVLTLSSHYSFVEEDYVTHGLDNIKGGNEFRNLYELGEIIGYGRYSEVRFASSKSTREIYACKIVNKLKIPQPWRLRDEIKILKSAKHRNIVSLHDIFETEREVLMLLELATGGELFNQIIQKGRYTEKGAKEIVRSLIDATSFLHSRNIIHRDIKPENILLGHDHDPNRTLVLISDFGLAKVLEDAADESDSSGMDFGKDVELSRSISCCSLETVGGRLRATSGCGSDYYVAPEILNGESYDEKVDMWSIGVVMFLLLSGDHPFGNDSGGISEVYSDIRQGNYKFSHPAWSNISPAAKDLVSRLLTVNPEKRISSKDACNHSWFQG